MSLLSPLKFVRARVSADPMATLWHYACGHMLDWESTPGGPTAWKRTTHRGVQWLDKVDFPRKQKRYIFSPAFDVKYDTAFEQTIRACGQRPPGEPTWITEEYVRAMVALHRMGYAYSVEAWQGGQLVGGAFGVQLGSIVTCDSMFHLADNASKAAWGQMLVRLRERGFKLVDTNGVAKHQVQYGEEWVPEWRFQQLLAASTTEWPTLTDDRAYPTKLPWEVRSMLPLQKIRRGIERRWPARFKRAAPNDRHA